MTIDCGVVPVERRATLLKHCISLYERNVARCAVQHVVLDKLPRSVPSVIGQYLGQLGNLASLDMRSCD